MNNALKFKTNRHTDATHGVSRWHDYLYTSRLGASTILASSVRRTGSEFLNRAADVRDQVAESRRQSDLAHAFGREVFARLYDADSVNPLDLPAAGTDLVQKAHELLTELPEWQGLAESVHGDPDMAALATANVLDSIAGVLPQVTKQEERQKEQEAEPQTGRRRSRRNRGPKADPDGTLRRALRAACSEAQETQAQVRASLGGLAPGLECTPATFEQDATERMRLAERVASDERLKAVMKLAGRLRRLADSGRKVRDEMGCDTLVGVTVGGDLPRILPTELALLRHKRMRRVQLAKLVDNRMFQYHLIGNTPKGRGPLTVLLDMSGSMMGDRSLWACSVALACMGIAVRERRACTVIGFNRQITYAYRVDSKGRSYTLDTHTMKAESEMGGPEHMALKLASAGCGGGTSFNAPFQAALDMEEGVTKERADLVLVTDGQADLSHHVLDRVIEAREETGLRVFGLTIGGGSLGEAVRQVCDSTTDLDDAIANDDGKGVANAIP
jgi:uncharacterized protein with von Willebrand factor type A (vWA) domain